TLPGQPEDAAQHVAQARTEAQDNLHEARRFVRALTPPDLANGSLPTALERLCATTTEHSGPVVRFQSDGEPVEVATPCEVALLRIAQSALANVTRHAQASRTDMTLSYMDTRVALDVVDDGVGFDPDSLPAAGSVDGGFGLAA